MDKALVGHAILVIEDEPMILMDIIDLLESAGALVTTATRVRDGMIAAMQPFSAAILDVRLPDGDIHPVASTLVERDVPIVFHSGNTQMGDLEAQFPDAAMLTKPVARSELLQTLIDRVHAGRPPNV